MVAPLLQKSRITNNPIILQYSKKMTSTAHRVGSRSTASGWCCWLVSACLILLSGTLAAETIDPPPTQFYVDDIKAAMAKHVQSLTVQDGYLHTVDDETLAALVLRFIQVHDPVRQINQGVYFACTDFHEQGNDEKIYDMDFWLAPVDGVLKVFQTKVHKEPRHTLLYGWYKHPRYTFVNDEIEYLY